MVIKQISDKYDTRGIFIFFFNLGLFACLVWSIFTFQNIRLCKKKKNSSVFRFCFFVLFCFYFSSLFDTKLFDFKTVYFNGYTILFQLIVISCLLFISKRSLDFHAPILSILFPLYFLFYFWNGRVFFLGQ